MQGILSGAIDPYSEECAFLPQAHYFDAPYGITLAVDNRYFPKTANELFEEYGYSMSIATSETWQFQALPVMKHGRMLEFFHILSKIDWIPPYPTPHIPKTRRLMNIFRTSSKCVINYVIHRDTI